MCRGSVARSCLAVDMNRIEGGAERAERARHRADLVIKAQAA